MGTAFEKEINNIKDKVKKLTIRDSPDYFYFTLHGIQHIDSCLNALDIILTILREHVTSFKDKFSVKEEFLLRSAICLHDVGMYLPSTDEDKICAYKEKKKLNDYIREIHPQRLDHYLKNEKRFFYGCGLNNDELVEILEICESHGVDDLKNISRKIQKLAALLCAIDLLDITRNRISIEFFELHISKMSLEEKWHWTKHLLIKEWIINEPKQENNSVVYEFDGIFHIIDFKPKYFLPTNAIEPKFENKISDEIKNCLKNSGINDILKREFGFSIDFTMDKNNKEKHFFHNKLGAIEIQNVLEHYLNYESKVCPEFNVFLNDLYKNTSTTIDTESEKTANGDYATYIIRQHSDKWKDAPFEKIAYHFQINENYLQAARYYYKASIVNNYLIPTDILTDKLYIGELSISNIREAYNSLRLYIKERVNEYIKLLNKSSENYESVTNKLENQFHSEEWQPWSYIDEYNISIEYGRSKRFLGEWEKAKNTFERCKAISDGLNDNKLRAESYIEYGSQIFEMGDVVGGISDAEEGLDLYKEFGISYGLIKTLKALGNMYREDGRWEKALDYLKLALNIMKFLFKNTFEKEKCFELNPLSKKIMICDCIREVGNVYACMNDFEKSESTYNEAMSIIKDEESHEGLKHLEGILLYHLGKIAIKKGEYVTAIPKLENSIDILEKFNNPIRQSFVYDALGSTYTNKDKNKAEEYLRKALKIREERKHLHFQAFTLYNFGIFYLKNNLYKQAIEKVNSAIEIWQGLSKSNGLGKFDIINAYCTLSKIYQSESQFKDLTKAICQLEHAKQYFEDFIDTTKDDNFSAEKLRGILFSITKIKRQRENRELKLEDYDYLTEVGEYIFHNWLEDNISDHIDERRIEVSIGDDAAVLKPFKSTTNGKEQQYSRFVLTTDAAPGSIFQSDDPVDGEYAAKFCVIQSTSDLLAMGATPVAILLNLYLKRDSTVPYTLGVLKKTSEEAKKYGMALIGGDIKERKQKSLGCVGIGVLPDGQPPIERKNAKEGQIVAISLANIRDSLDDKTGTVRKIGKRWAADVLEKIHQTIGFSQKHKARLNELLSKYKNNDIKRALLFLPFKEMIEGATTNKIASAIDTSDGFMACLEILARESEKHLKTNEHKLNDDWHLGFILEEELIKNVIDKEVIEIAEMLDYHEAQFLFNAGHDWEIVMTIDDNDFDDVQKAFRDEGGDLAPLGRVVKYTNQLNGREIGIVRSEDIYCDELRDSVMDVYKVPIFTDEKFVSMAYEERVSEWEDLNVKRCLDKIFAKPIKFNYNPIPNEYYIK